MALSDQERRLLEQLEASLLADDPTFADTLRGDSHVRVERRRATLSGIGFVAGVVALLAGMQVHPVVSILGFVVMLASAIIGISAWQRVSVADEPRGPRPTQDHPGGATGHKQDFLDQLDERWRRQQDGDPEA